MKAPRSLPAGTQLRLARDGDVPALAALIPLSVRALQFPFYSAAQTEAALGPVFDVDRQLIADGTYFVIERDGRIIGCGGWSRRKSVCGGDAGRTGPDALLDPARDPARIRAFFIHPDHARQGLGTALLEASETALQAAGFSSIELVATLAGEPLYAAHSYTVVERYELSLTNGLPLAVVRMSKKVKEINEPAWG